jgi:EAL domain-containing protein (putative c-di-GMP-specific phosphodiesterase class I)
VTSALAASGLPARRLELEITESVLLEESEAVLATLHRLRGLGARIAMDDFGTGYSSLSYLRSFPFDKIKIDRSFVRGLSSPPGGDGEQAAAAVAGAGECAAIVRAIAGLGASFGMATTAEGVETEEQLRRIRDEGCTEAQGFLVSRPVPAGEIDGLLAAVNGGGPARPGRAA